MISAPVSAFKLHNIILCIVCSAGFFLWLCTYFFYFMRISTQNVVTIPLSQLYACKNKLKNSQEN